MNHSYINKRIDDYYNASTDAWIEIHGANRVEGFSFNKNIEFHDKILEDYFKFKPGQRVLDAGCGVGYPSINFAKKNPYTLFYLVNLNTYQLSKIVEPPTNINIFNCDFNSLIFPSNYFDTVYFLESFSHSLKKSNTVTEILRVLKPGGKVFLLDFCRKTNIDKEKLNIHREVYTHFPVYSSLLKKLFINRGFKENFFLEDMQNNIFTPDKFDTGTFYCYNKNNQLTEFGKIHEKIYKHNAHVQYPVFCSFIK